MKNKETRLFLPCGCAGNCNVLAVDRWQWDGDDPEWWFEVYTRTAQKSSLRWRLRTALRVLLHRDHYLDALIFDDSEIAALRSFIDARLPLAWTVTPSTAQFTGPFAKPEAAA